MIEDVGVESSSLAIILQGFTSPPHAVPLLVIDLGLDREEEVRRTLHIVENEGLSRVHSLGGQVFPASLDWTYSYTMTSGTTGASVTLYLRDEPAFSSTFHVARDWAVLEEDFEIVVLALDNFQLNTALGDPASQVSLVKASLRDGGVRGATIARDPRHRSDPLFIPDKWQ